MIKWIKNLFKSEDKIEETKPKSILMLFEKTEINTKYLIIDEEEKSCRLFVLKEKGGFYTDKLPYFDIGKYSNYEQGEEIIRQKVKTLLVFA